MHTLPPVPLKITLKPRETILVGGALIKNGEHVAQFTVENEVPILRQKDILTERDAKTVCRKIYYVIQLMYFEPGHLPAHHQTYWQLVRALSSASTSPGSSEERTAAKSPLFSILGPLVVLILLSSSLAII